MKIFDCDVHPTLKGREHVFPYIEDSWRHYLDLAKHHIAADWMPSWAPAAPLAYPSMSAPAYASAWPRARPGWTCAGRNSRPAVSR